jgi:hypothetical protein
MSMGQQKILAVLGWMRKRKFVVVETVLMLVQEMLWR